MFGWLEDLINGITGAISDAFAGIGQTISNTIWSTMMKWMYETVFDAIADFFTMMGSMGAEIFDLSWVQATVELFTLFGWALFAAGVVVAVFDLAIEYQNGRANIKTTALNILKGFFACSLIGVVPISLYKFCISLQHEFAGNLASLFAGGKATSIAQQSLYILQHNFAQEMVTGSLFNLLALIAFAYCVIKVFTQWMKQVAAICLTAFMQTTLLFLGLMTFSENMLLGLGVMLAANEVPRIAQQFGLDSSAKFNLMSAVHATTTAINLSRTVARAGK